MPTLKDLLPNFDPNRAGDPGYMAQFRNPALGYGGTGADGYYVDSGAPTYVTRGADGQMYDLGTNGSEIQLTSHYGSGNGGGGTYDEFGMDGSMLNSRQFQNDPNGMRDFIGMGAMVLGPLAAGGAFSGAAAASADSGGAAVSGMDMAADTPGFAGSYAGGASSGVAAGGGAAGGGMGGGGAGGGAGGAGMQWGTGPGGAMTAADYARYAQMAGGAAGMLASKGGGGGGGSGQQYVPGGMPGADATWQGAMHGSYDLASGARGMASGGFDRSFADANAIDYSPYLQRSQQSGDAYAATGDAAMGQMGQYGQRAGVANGQQDLMYGAGRNVLTTAFDPQNALHDRTQQQLQDQVRAGQAARGLGNSEAGAMEEAGAMSNFNIDWQNAQLGRQATGIQAAGGATSAGDGAGRLAGADWSAGLQAGAAGAGYYGQAGQVPMAAEEYAAGAPGRASAGLVGGYGSMQGMYGNAQSGIIPYLNAGNGAIQGNYGNNYQANRDMVSGMTQLAGAAGPTVAGWFGSGSGGNAGTQWSTNWGTAMNGSYGDSAYG